MRCKDIMKRKIECVFPEDTAQLAATRMRDENIGFLPVCDQSGKVLGTVTDRDIAIRVVAGDKPGTTRVADVMTNEVVACRPEDDLQEAERLMGRNHKSRIMVIDDGWLVGIISLSDIVQHETGERAGETLRNVAEREARA